MAFDGAGFCAAACTTFVDPWLGFEDGRDGGFVRTSCSGSGGDGALSKVDGGFAGSSWYLWSWPNSSGDAGLTSPCNPSLPVADHTLDHNPPKQFPRAHFDDEQLDDSINGSGLAVEAAGFGAGDCMTFVEPCSGPDGTELDDKVESDDSIGFPPRLEELLPQLL